MNFRAFNPNDLYQIDLQPRQQNFAQWAPPNYACSLADRGSCYTLIEADTIIACTGVIDMDLRDGMLWLFLARHASGRMLAVTRIAERFIGCSGKKRLFASCEVDFDAAHRWFKLLGFQCVKPLEGYGPDGAEHLLYCRSLH